MKWTIAKATCTDSDGKKYRIETTEDPDTFLKGGGDRTLLRQICVISICNIAILPVWDAAWE
jgi:hypothetical protein